MEYIRPLNRSQRMYVHALLDKDETWCRWKIMSGEVLNGQTVPRASSDPGPLTCKKCMRAMNVVIKARLTRDLSPAQIAQILELSTKLVLDIR